jgi:high affinity Mn2+ porin
MGRYSLRPAPLACTAVFNHAWALAQGAAAPSRNARVAGQLRRRFLAGIALILFDAGSLALAADPAAMPVKAAAIWYGVPPAYDWNGFYVGAHLGYGWGRSNWSEGPDFISGSFNLAKSFDAFQETGSFFAGLQAGYDYMFANRVVLGVAVDASAPSFHNQDRISIGGMSFFTTPTLGPQTFGETTLMFGTVRARVGYAPGDWLFYATGGYALTRNQAIVTQLGSGPTDAPLLWRFGWTAGGGVEFPVKPHWTASLEYLYTRYGHTGTFFPNAGQGYDSDFSLQQVRLGLNYRFGDVADKAPMPIKAPAPPDPDLVNFHGQSTFSMQTYPRFRAPYDGTNSLPGRPRPAEISDVTLYAGLRLWQGAELWFVPEIDQGFGLASTHGVAGFPSAEAYKEGFAFPYARIQRAFVRQTIDLGGKSEKVGADISQFAGAQTENRLVLTVGRFAIVDIFDTNKYANNPKLDFLNWVHVNTGTFDYAGDGWGYTYGAAAEWYQGRWTLRGGVFDLSKTPAGGVSPNGLDLDSNFGQFELVGEIEERHELWGQPGKLKITGFLERGRMGKFADAIALAQLTGQPADINAVRVYRSRPGVSVNLEQQVSDNVGVFARAGWADGTAEPWDFTDVDRTLSAGVSLSGKQWGRPNDTVGMVATVNQISGVHQQFFNAGGLGILIGDDQLPNPGLERIIEAYYSYGLTPSTRLTFDYQFIVNPAYNTDRGPVSVFGARAHTQF